jgi:hypothetical protein
LVGNTAFSALHKKRLQQEQILRKGCNKVRRGDVAAPARVRSKHPRCNDQWHSAPPTHQPGRPHPNLRLGSAPHWRRVEDARSPGPPHLTLWTVCCHGTDNRSRPAAMLLSFCQNTVVLKLLAVIKSSPKQIHASKPLSRNLLVVYMCLAMQIAKAAVSQSVPSNIQLLLWRILQRPSQALLPCFAKAVTLHTFVQNHRSMRCGFAASSGGMP